VSDQYADEKYDCPTGRMYNSRDVEQQGEFYFNHISAMTGEQLHSKTDIAAELAHRDIEIAKLKQEIVQLRKMVVRPCPTLYTVQRIRKTTEDRYGSVHGAGNDRKTVCGKEFGDGDFFILTNNHTGDITCKACKKLLDLT